MRKLTALLAVLLSLSLARAQNPQSSTTIAQPADTKYNNGVGNGYRPTKLTGLTLNLGPGTTQCDALVVEYAGGTKTMTDAATNYVYLDPLADCAPAVNTSGFTTGTFWVAKVTTSGGAITAIVDMRTAAAVTKIPTVTGGGTTGGNGTGGQGSYAISGCQVAYTSGLSFTVGACTYVISGTQYTSAQSNVTLTTADGSNPRVDVIAVNSSAAVEVVTGTAASSPAEPSVDPATQLRLIAATVAAGATTPSSITTVDIYQENTEYTCAVSSNLACASTSNPFVGSKDIEATSAVAGNNVTLTKPSGTLDLSTYSTLLIQIRSKASWPNAKALSVFWSNGTTNVGSTVAIKTGNCGFVSSVTSGYQLCAINLGSFAAGATAVNKLHIVVAGGGGSIGFYLDSIQLQSGTTTGSGGPSTFTVTAVSPLAGGGTAPVGGNVNVSCPTCGTGSGNVSAGGTLTSPKIVIGQGTTAVASIGTPTACSAGSYARGIDANGDSTGCTVATTGSVTTTGSPTSGELTKFSGASTITNADLSGDVSTSGSAVTTVAKVNGIAYSATAAAHSVEVITTANTTATAKTLPDCTDTGGNHINYTQSTDAWSCGTSGGVSTPVSIANGGTGTGSTLTGLVRGNASAMTAAELSGDATTSGSNAVTVAKVNGVAYGSSPSTDTVPVITASNTETYKAVADCDDTGGNHLNYDTGTHAFSCGTSGSGGATTNTHYLPFDQCSAGESANVGNAFWSVVALTNWDAGHWEFVKNSAADIFCSVRIPHNVAGTPAAKVVLDLGANDATASHTDAFKICDAITSSLNLQVGSLTCSSTQNFTTTSTAYANTELEFTPNATIAADQILVVKIHQDASNSVTNNVIMPPPKLKIAQTL